MPNDPVNHPEHYTKGRVETIEVLEQIGEGYSWPESYLVATCAKYLCRAPYKGNALQDLKKARWYLQRAIESLADSPHPPKDD